MHIINTIHFQRIKRLEEYIKSSRHLIKTNNALFVKLGYYLTIDNNGKYVNIIDLHINLN